jgi:hypothetical protein
MIPIPTSHLTAYQHLKDSRNHTSRTSLLNLLEWFQSWNPSAGGGGTPPPLREGTPLSVLPGENHPQGSDRPAGEESTRVVVPHPGRDDR